MILPTGARWPERSSSCCSVIIAPSNKMQPVPEDSEPSPDDVPTQRDTFRSTAATAQTVMNGASKWLKQVGKSAQEAAIAAGHTAQEAALSVSGAVDQYSSQVSCATWIYHLPEGRSSVITWSMPFIKGAFAVMLALLSSCWISCAHKHAAASCGASLPGLACQTERECGGELNIHAAFPTHPLTKASK